MQHFRPRVPLGTLLAFASTFLLAAGCSTSKGPPAPASPPSQATADQQILRSAERDVTQHRPEAAIAVLDPLIDRYVAFHRNSETDVYCARSLSETAYYMMLAQSQGRTAVAIDPAWAEAYYLKGYALIELGRVDEARATLEKARALSPRNSTYLSELAHAWQADRQWERSLELFVEAEDASRMSPDELRTEELTRALRGQGFSLIELGRIDEAEARFKASLAADRNDRRSKEELVYIEQLRRQSNP